MSSSGNSVSISQASTGLASNRLVSSRLVSSRLVSSRLVSSRLVSSRLVSSRSVSSPSVPGRSPSVRSWDRRSVFVVCLLPSTRPSPLVRNRRQSSPHRILLHISNQGSKLLVGTNPMIVGFVLPKRQAATAQNLVRHAGGSPLEPPHDRGILAPKLPNYMHVVGHKHPSVKVIQVAPCLPIQQGVGNHLRHASIGQPARAVRLARHRSGQSPRHGQNRLIWNPVRQMYAIQEHRFAKRQTTENRWSVLRQVVPVPSGSSL